ncbi:hydroxyindole O-methyltransferase [Microdochium trichocladiopsis]|uniref:Hydroxyindole O-methyltransferase n=1 Tax=Microdochium trichocladiopsis TaxID=1682393 RepID=A0A9P8YAC5_9PEZI|nr:hydroxyindole O-methyltransferase [Microdochium trichocladiopsis]KAH7034612.1 hydroxyindole O-methyltransferase [Microdochium trichocladiopsis]
MLPRTGTNTASIDVRTALEPNDFPAVPSIIGDISALSKVLKANDRNSRLQVLEKARELVRALETPRETMIKHTWAQNTAFTAISFGVDTGLWKQWVENGSNVPQKVSSLAAQLRLDPAVLGRFLKHISAMGYIIETGPDEYKLTNFTKSLSLPIIADSYPLCLWSINNALANLHGYLRETDFAEPTSATDGNYQHAHHIKADVFTHFQENPPNGPRFNNLMSGYRQGRPSWMDKDFFPVEEKMIDGFDPSGDGVLLVDIGGNVGHDLDEFRRKFPDHPGKLVLQDLERVINQIEHLDEGIVRMPHDFFTENPIKGARAYYLHTVLHDWPDDLCVKILSRVSEAMKPGYSKLLINEQVIPARNAHWEATCLDILMMSLLSSKERTEAEWRNLVEVQTGANLRIVRFWSVGNGVENLIEIEKVL